METVPQIEKSASMIPKIERKDTFHKQKKLTNPAPFNPLEVVRNYKDLTIDPVFSSFTNWLQEYQGVICSQGDNCSDHDPRYIRNLLLRGERLSRTRAKVMQKIIIGDPKSAISLGIPEQTAEKLPEIVRRNLEKWESSLANVKTAHSCFSTDHQGCEIRREAKFNDGRHMRVWTFGSRKGFGTVSNLSVWGVSIGQDFAMADSPLQVFEESDTTGSARFGGDTYTYTSLAERNYFSYLINEAERRVGSFQGGSIQYPLAMGSGRTMGTVLGNRYTIKAEPARFDQAYEDAINSGTLLQIESQEENDFICELLSGNLLKGQEGINLDFVPWIWLGATDDENQSGIGYNRAERETTDFNLSASEGNWKWLNGQDVNKTYSNWAGGINPPFTQHGLAKPTNHAYLNYVTGEWNNTLGPWWAGPRDAQVDVGLPFGLVSRIGNPFINLNGDIELADPGSLLPYVIEHNLIADHGRSQDVSLNGIRKVLVIPARFFDQTEYYYSSRAFTGSNSLLTDQFGNPTNPEISKQPYIPISVDQMKQAMDEVSEFFLNTTDRELQLEPVFAPTVTIPYNEGTAIPGGSGSSQFDSEGNLTGPAVWSWGASAELSIFAESAKRTVGEESEEYDFYGPAFVGIDEVEINTTTQTAGETSYLEAPTITITGGAFINPNTGLPHVKFQPADAEAILNEDGNLTGIRITNPGAYYFDPDFGSRYDYYGRSIFDYNYSEDDLKPIEKDRSPLHKNFRDLCVILDSDGDGFAEYDLVRPRILIDGNDSYEANFSVSVDNICITWVVATTYQFGKKFEGETEEGDGEEFDYNFTYNPGIAWVGAPGSHIAIRNDANNTPSISSRTIAHEIGHNLGLWHDQGYSSKGEHALSDEAAKIPYGNPYPIMGGGEISMGGHFSLPAQTTLNEIFQGKAGFSSGNAQGVDVLEINSSAGLNVSLKELNAPNPNTFRIYRNNFHTPPGSLREDNFSIYFPDDNLSWFVNEYFGQSNSSSNLSAHDNNRTASDLNLSVELTVLGTGEDANVTLHFKNGHFPRLEILNGGRGFHKDPILVLQKTDETESFIIDPDWVYEENASRKAQLYDNDFASRWIRGMRIKTDAAGKGNYLPNGDEVDDNLSQYFLSYRTDSSLYGLNVLLANDPRGQFLPDRETFLIDTTPNTPNSMEDAPLHIGSTFSDYDSDIHITPVRIQSGTHISELHQLYDEIKEVKHKIEIIKANRFIMNDEDNVFTFTSEFNADLARYESEIASIYEDIVLLEEKSYPYIEVVVNIGTTATAQAPEFQLFVENAQPQTGEYIEMAVVMKDGNSSGYAYSWFINEEQVSNPHYLNQPVIYQPFNQPGKQVVRVVVSDMKGGLASKTLVIQVAGETPANNNSLVSGNVRSSQGLMQGARVVVEKAPTFDHLVSQTGTLRDSFYPTGLNNPAQLTINGEVSPTLEVHRGEIHRFYFENDFDENFTFLEKPEAAPPRVSVNMLAGPRRSLTNFGGLYVRNPEIKYEMNSTFNAYVTEFVAPFTEVIDPHGNPGTPGLHSITRPYAKALMEESNISYGRVGPLEIDEFGYLTYGGKGYDRNNPPRVEIRRVSIWEDYGDSNATGQAYVDGVGTISPVNSVNPRTGLSSFMGQAWETRKTEDLNGTKLPELIIWGSGGDTTGEEPDRDVNATVIEGKDEYRYIEITNQGQGYEPDGTMAVLHYPLDPFAYWTFDRHETLFEDNQSSRYQPSPVWNRQLFFNDMIHRWSFDEENGSTIIANSDKDLNYTVPSQWFPNGLGSQFGLSGRALEWNATVLDAQVIDFSNALPDDNYTVSFWANPRNDFNVTLGSPGGGLEYKLSYDFSTNDTNVTEGGTSILGLGRANPQYSDWVHIAFSNNRRDDEVNLYINGRGVVLESKSIDTFGDLNFTAFDGLLDELLIFDRALEEPAIKYLAGRSYLDISGNKFHMSPMSDNLIPVAPGTDGSSLDVPQDASFLPEAKTSADNQGRLGDTFLQENHGHSLSLNGLDDYLDLSAHKDEFSLSQGTISVWVKVPQQFNENLPILWISKPFSFTDINITDPVSGNSTIERQFDPGQYFSMDIQNGWPRIGGFIAEGLQNKVNLSGEWRHVVGAFPSGRIWIDGEEVSTALYDSEGIIFTSSTNPLEFIFDADTFWVGKSSNVDKELENYYEGKIDDLAIYDRELTDEEIYFLYELRRGREQIPRLQALVDAIGTVEIIDSGSGYRENPKLVFGYGEVMDKNSLPPFLNLATLETQKTEDNTSHGEQVLVQFNDDGNLINHVYSFHMGADPDRNYSYQNELRKDGQANGWRKHISAHGIGEYENAVLGDVVWTKRLSTPKEIVLPDQNTTMRRFVEYVTTNKSRSSSSEVNQTNVHNYFKPNGLYGFVQVPDTNVSEPGVHNSEATEEESAFFKAEAYILYHIDHDAEESIDIVDQGVGMNSNASLLKSFLKAENSVKVSGRGYRPSRANLTYSKRPPFGGGDVSSAFSNIYDTKQYTYAPKEQWEQEEELLDDADPQLIDGTELISTYGYHVDYDWIGTHDHDVGIDTNKTDFNQSLAEVMVDDPGFGYSVPIEVKSWGGYPELGIEDMPPMDPQIANATAITYQEAKFIVTEVDENGSITKIEMDDNGTGYYEFNPRWDNSIFSKITYPHFRFPSSFSITDPDANLTITGPSGKNGWAVATRPVMGYISVTGGGGMGAEIWITGLNAAGEVEGNRTHPDIVILDGGRGYYNIDPDNLPEANVTRAGSGESNATVEAKLGGYLTNIPKCKGCPGGDNHQHVAPWVEIWDRGRPELRIDQLNARAHAAPKVVNGKIEKVVVTNGGSGYIDPVAIIRDIAPKISAYKDADSSTTAVTVYRRIWKCTNLRVNLDGEEEECGHVQASMYPPDECPGETDSDYPYQDENGTVIPTIGLYVEGWRERHENPEIDYPIEDPVYDTNLHKYCIDAGELSSVTGHDHNNSTHLDVRFLSRKCWGTKENYVLLNPHYRSEPEAWQHLDANLSVVSHNGRIKEIIVDYSGDNYFAPAFTVEGSGSGVDAIPVYDDQAKMTRVIFDDPELKNVQLDTHITRPAGAGQGFRERPWTWDNTYESRSSPREKIEILTKFATAPGVGAEWAFGSPTLGDHLGDRILSVDVLDHGIYRDSTDLTQASIDYNTSVRIAGFGLIDFNQSDFDGDGYSDFVDAQIRGIADFRLNRFFLDGNGTFEDWTEANKSLTPRGLFIEQPSVSLLDGRNAKIAITITYTEETLEGGREVQSKEPSSSSPFEAFPYMDENLSSFIRLNGQVGYDPEKDRSFIELYIDDRFPNQLYYGIGQAFADGTGAVLPQMGGKILVSEGLPGKDWIFGEPAQKKYYAYTDQNGYYAISGLEPGLYNVTTMMEDERYQDLSFRTDANSSRISHLLYIPGFPDLTLVSDNFGVGTSSLVWSQESQKLSRVAGLSVEEEFDLEYLSTKRLDGIGRGFDPNGLPPVLTFIPHPENFGKTVPHVDLNVSIDGSLSLRIIDDENTSTFFPNDRFTVRYDSSVSGVDFYQSYRYSDTNKTYGSGVKASWESGSAGARLLIFPDDANGSNPIEAALSSVVTEWNPSSSSWEEVIHQRPLVLRAEVYEANGSRVSFPQVDWKLSFDFNASEGNNTMLAQLVDGSNSPGHGELNASGNLVALYLYSHLRKNKGIVKEFEIVDGGQDYQIGDAVILEGEGYGFVGLVSEVNASNNDSILDINITHGGYKYGLEDTASVTSSAGAGASLKPVFYDGTLWVEANYTLPSGTKVSKKVSISPQISQKLTAKEEWANLYLDTIFDRDQTWWASDTDVDKVSNNDEYYIGTDPDRNDTDNDNLTDLNETNFLSPSDPLNHDSDGDGLSDFTESQIFTDPRLQDTDADGLTDKEEFDDPNLDPIVPDGEGLLTGRIYKLDKYAPYSPVLYYRMSRYDSISNQDILMFDWCNTWNFMEGFLNKTGLNYDLNYTVEAYLDMDDGGHDQNYSYGEPYAVQEHNLTEDFFDIRLTPSDPGPTIRIDQPTFIFDYNNTSLTNQIVLDVDANDSFYNNTALELSLTKNTYGLFGTNFDGEYGSEKVIFLVEGNLSDYLSNETNNSKLVNLDYQNIPPGYWTLRFTAMDEHDNLSTSDTNSSLSYAELNVTIVDDTAPFITFLDHQNKIGATLFTLLDLNQSGSVSNTVLNYELNETNSSFAWEWNASQPFEFSDFNSSASNNLQVHAWDIKNDLIDDWIVTVDYNESDPVGKEQDLDYWKAIFADGNFSSFSISMDEDGKYSLPAESPSGVYRFRFQANDLAENTAALDLYLLKGATYTSTEITAVDGYLYNARVIFDGDGDGLSDLSREFLTDINGRAQISFTREEFERFDKNGNGKLDSDEGKFIVIGGFDTSTNAFFPGKLIADANSSVITPLTTMVSQLMDDGASKTEALTAIALALQLDPKIDLTTYDPIQMAFEGDPFATQVMSANLRMANLVNQAEGLLLTLSPEYQGYSVGTYLLGEIARRLNQNADAFELEGALVDAIPLALASVGIEGDISLEDQLAMFQLIAELDQSIQESEEELSFEELMDRQIDLIKGLDDLFVSMGNDRDSFTQKEYLLKVDSGVGGSASIGGLHPYGTKVVIIATAEEGYKFDRWKGLGVTDENANSTFVLMTEDRNLTALFSTQYHEVNVAIEGKGEVSGIGSYPHGEVAVLSALPGDGYYFESWFGDILNQPLNTSISITVTEPLFLVAKFSPDAGQPGPESSSQSKEDEITDLDTQSKQPIEAQSNLPDQEETNENSNLFSPIGVDFELFLSGMDFDGNGTIKTLVASDLDGDQLFFKIVSENPNLDQDKSNLFFLSDSGNLKIADTDDLLLASGSTIQMLFSVSDGQHSSSLSGVVKIAPSFILDSTAFGNGWHKSDWLGIFYTTREKWMYHHPLGWLYFHDIYPDGLWLWDDLASGWFWTKKEFYPWLYRSSTESWFYHKLDDGEVKVFDQTEKSWKLRK
ncbi:hypothetical protein N8988_00625 [Opitutales bacterium]|nr:hypothetical protein [Opitutales bacterium]